MKNLRVANRYAKALLGLAEDENFSEKAFEDMKLIFDVFEENRELQSILKSPIVRIAKKLNILNSIFSKHLHPVTMHYLSIIARKKRAALIQGIAHEFLKIHRERQDVEEVTLITASDVDIKHTQSAKRIAATLTPRSNIEFNHVFDPGIIGGFILRIGDLQYDASVKKKISVIKKHLLEK